ncbi:E3 ubiquitin-protein ligase MIB2 [Elysia marginata]|uniref:E3 ubiquitin-protein ligase MIB2 n=1 Tax=Elysia marginata TaxID=1093978 RepID=A0AAV4ICQ7_9GAST|nr:E3 ubiquitin-protein ligase MIB2 [Elysia marginata]
MRWKCTKCRDFDLCTACYMADKHDLQHTFLRFDTTNSKGTKVPKRANSQTQRVQSLGVFPGARVSRGPDWDWGNQDGEYCSIVSWFQVLSISVIIMVIGTGRLLSRGQY